MKTKKICNYNRFLKMAMGCFIMVLIFACSAFGQAQNDLLYFKLIPGAQADKYYEEALSLKKTGNVEQALEKYESAIVSKRFLLSKNDSGLKEALVSKYRTLSASNREIEVYYKLAYLLDLTGDLTGSIKYYGMALELAATDTIKQHITSLLNGVKKDKSYYEKPQAEAFKDTPIDDSPSPAGNDSKPTIPKKQERDETADKIRESKIADYKDRIDEISRKITDVEKALSEAKSEERKSKNDWSGREDFKRDWRNTEPVDPLVDKSDPYQNTYRRRYRQAKSERETIEKEIVDLKEEKSKVEGELKDFELINADAPPAAPEEEKLNQENKNEETESAPNGEASRENTAQ